MKLVDSVLFQPQLYNIHPSHILIHNYLRVIFSIAPSHIAARCERDPAERFYSVGDKELTNLAITKQADWAEWQTKNLKSIG